MPWKRFGKCVFKTTKSGEKKKKQGCSDSVPMAKKYLKALYANSDDVSEQVDGYLNEIVLSEAKFKDVKAKYAQYDDLVDGTRDEIKKKIGDKGVSKYLLYVMREIHRMFDEPETEDEVLDEQEFMIPVIDNLIDMVAKYEKNISRIDQKDIYQLNAAELEKLVNNLGKSSTQQKKETKGKIHKESVLIHYDDDVLAVRPLTTDASNYYGMGTKWCISATECENFFDQYTIDGKAFVMLMLKNNQRSSDDVIKSKFGKVALEYNSDGAYIRAWDSPDVTMDLKKLTYAMSVNMYDEVVKDDRLLNVKRLLNDIIDKGSKNVVDQPTPHPMLKVANKVKEMKKDAESKLKDAFLTLDPFDQEINYFTTFDIPLPDNLKLKSPKEELEHMRAFRARAMEILDAYMVGEYPSYNDIKKKKGKYVIYMDFAGEIVKDERDYAKHLGNMLTLQQNFKNITKNVEKFFAARGYFQDDEKTKTASDKLGKIDAADGTDPVNEVNDYFKELLKTELDCRIEKMTIKEWLDPECPAPWDEDYEDKK